MAGRGQACAAQEAEQVRFTDVEALLLERGADNAQGRPLTAELAGPLVDRLSFRRSLAPGPSGCEEGVDVGVASEVADDRSNGTDVKMKPLGDFVGGCLIVEVSPTDLVVTLGWEIGQLEQASEFWGASHGC